MTEYEAVEYFKRHIELYCVTGICRDAEEIAIKALEQELCGDAISRQATVERLCKVAEFMNEKRNGLGSPYVMAALFIQDNKDEFPPVTPQYTDAEIQKMQEMEQAEIQKAYELGKAEQSKIGRWIYDKNIENWRCSECGETPKTRGYCGSAVFMEEHFKYCNHCGAKMTEVEDEESN